ncbi:hypothetical protein MAR_020412 [Mya arenaria]|uniref:Uncharacterized protein n=1 Tax=Mya arenaria TaxID=6604 RepID=A0ABY7E4V3_MYAAR|nr:hypothetical protein MAR_020412 [Mya arenaria]
MRNYYVGFTNYLQHLYEVAKTEATANHDATRGTTPARQNVINDAKQPRYDKVELTAVILPIVIGIVAVIAVVAGVYWRKRQMYGEPEIISPYLIHTQV